MSTIQRVERNLLYSHISHFAFQNCCQSTLIGLAGLASMVHCHCHWARQGRKGCWAAIAGGAHWKVSFVAPEPKWPALAT